MKRNMTTQNIRRAATGLLMMLLTATTAGAQETISGLTYNTAGGYYEIKDAQDLVDLATYVNAGNDAYGKTFKQTANITFAHTSDWNDTSSEEHNFNGIGYVSKNSKAATMVRDLPSAESVCMLLVVSFIASSEIPRAQSSTVLSCPTAASLPMMNPAASWVKHFKIV